MTRILAKSKPLTGANCSTECGMADACGVLIFHKADIFNSCFDFAEPFGSAFFLSDVKAAHAPCVILEPKAIGSGPTV